MFSALLKDPPVYTKDEEKALFAKWRAGDKEAIGEIIHGRARWVLSVVSKMTLPRGTDLDAVFADVIGEIFIAMRNFDPARGLTAYLYPVIKRTAYQSSGIPIETVECDRLLDNEQERADSVLCFLRDIIDATPMNELNSTHRMILKRMLDGESPAKIAHLMDWSFEKSARIVKRLRQYLAWHIVEADVSGEPWLCDRDLAKLAAEHEQVRRQEVNLFE